MAKKFRLKTAMDTAIPAAAGGLAVGYVNKLIADKVPDAKLAALIPLGLGAYLGATGSAKMAALGLGMVGASGPGVLAAFGVEGIGEPLTVEEVDEFEEFLTGPDMTEDMDETLMGGLVYDDDDDDF